MSPNDAMGLVDLRVGRITRAEPNEKARKPAYKLWIDFGEEIGTRTSSAQLTELYEAATLPGRLAIVAVNVGTRKHCRFSIRGAGAEGCRTRTAEWCC